MHDYKGDILRQDFYLLLAVFCISLTSTVISVDDGLLRTSTGCAGPPSSLMLYVD